MISEFDGELENSISIICSTSEQRVTDDNLKYDNRKSLIWELVDSILNATIGKVTKTYRLNSLTRLNDVSFRPTIAVI